jgi:hypothetical protein
MDLTVLIVAVLLIASLAYAVRNKLNRESEQFSRTYRPPEIDDWDDEDDDSDEDALVFSGIAAFDSDPFPLGRGSYRLRFWFPEEILVKVELFTADGADHEVLALRLGEGEETFDIDAPGDYVLVVEPAEVEAAWELEITPLGLPSQRR